MSPSFRGRGQRPDNRRQPAARINDRIRVPEVRVIGDDGEQLGIMNTRDAVRMARERGLDLVEVAPTAQPPVCRIIDYGKFQYETSKKQKEAKKKQVIITVKEVKFRPGTDDHDYNFKMKHARQWLEEGDKVKATIFFRGREITHRELGTQLLARLERDLADMGEVEARPRMEGNQMFLIFAPKKHKAAGGGGSQKSEGGPKPDGQTPPAPPTQGLNQ
ncbi:MAG: translation initiation factor IF-3 [Acidobacteria bacterium]|nr:MAG: translation initiation factor IF-3 [Acidobacteriota bacterium]